MKILLINNNTEHLKALSAALAGHEVEIQSYQPGLDFHHQEKDLVILSGGGGEGREAQDRHKDGDLWYKDELQFILDCPKPLLGICMGFELIAHAHGSKIEKLSKGLEGLESFHTEKGQPITQFESHDYAVQQLSQKHFKVVAKSKTGYEIIHHRHRPILAAQFHPELGGTLSLPSLVYGWDKAIGQLTT